MSKNVFSLYRVREKEKFLCVWLALRPKAALYSRFNPKNTPTSFSKSNRYEYKLRELQSLINLKLVHKVLWVAGNERVGKDLLDVAGGARGVLIERYENLTKVLQPGRAL